MAEFTQKVRSRQNVCCSQTLIAPHKKETQSPVWPRALSCFLLVLIDSVSLHVSTPPPSLTAAVCGTPPWRPQRRPSTGSCVRELVVWRGGRKVTRQAERLVVSGGCQDAWPPALDITDDGWVSARPLRLSCLSRLAIQEVMFSERLKDYFFVWKGERKVKGRPRVNSSVRRHRPQISSAFSLLLLKQQTWEQIQHLVISFSSSSLIPVINLIWAGLSQLMSSSQPSRTIQPSFISPVRWREMPSRRAIGEGDWTGGPVDLLVLDIAVQQPSTQTSTFVGETVTIL